MEPEVIRLPIGTVTAAFDGLEIALLKHNLGWYPRDESPLPADGEVFTTFLVRVRNGSAEPRSLEPTDFGYRTLAFPLGTGPVWDTVPEGRPPRLEASMLAPGEEFDGWLTYRVPQGEYPDELLWSPNPDVTFAIYLPPVGSSSRFQRALVFGRVTDAAGNPVPGAEVLVTPVDPDIPGDPSRVGDCTGTPLFAEQATTDPSGWYSVPLETHLSDRLCVEVQARARLTSGLVEGRAGGGVVVPSQTTAFAEAPEVRVDVVLPAVP